MTLSSKLLNKINDKNKELNNEKRVEVPLAKGAMPKRLVSRSH